MIHFAVALIPILILLVTGLNIMLFDEDNEKPGGLILISGSISGYRDRLHGAKLRRVY